MTVMTSKGQVTIPKRVRDRLGLKAGAEVEFIERENGEIMIKSAPGEPVSDYRKRASGVIGSLDLGMTTDDFMMLLRGDEP